MARGRVLLTGRRASILLIAAAFASAATAPQAPAASWNAGRYEPEAVALAGDRVQWLAPLPKHRVGLFAGRNGDSPRRIQSFYGSRRYLSVHPIAFAASPRAVVLGRLISLSPPVCCGFTQREYFLGPVGGHLEPDGRCEAGGGGAVDIHNATIVRVRCDRRVEVRELDGGEPPVIVGRSAYSATVAGRYIAWIEGDYDTGDPRQTVLYDRVTGNEVYRLIDPPNGRRVSAVDVQEDGTLALVVRYGTGTLRERSRIGWSSPAAPGLRLLPLAPRVVYRASIASNRIAFIRAPESDTGDMYEVGTVDLQGNARLVSRHARSFTVAFDGRRIAYVRRREWRYEVVVDRRRGAAVAVARAARHANAHRR